MQGDDMLVNRVAQSGLITLDLADYFPEQEIVVFDLKDHLVQGLMLMEKKFRESLQEQDWSQYQDKIVTLTCSADAIVPRWAYMLAATYLQPVAARVMFGSVAEAEENCLLSAIDEIDVSKFENERIIIKGCGDKEVSESAYLAITNKLLPVVKSLMYGEPCSTVPVFKQKQTK